jgi:hypothetical protein
MGHADYRSAPHSRAGPIRCIPEPTGAAALTTADLAAEADSVVPLSVSRAEEIAALRAWAAERAVPAD